MLVPELGSGICFAVGGTNFRVGNCTPEGVTLRSDILPTPDKSEEFFRKAARTVLDSAEEGAQWAVLGIPGLVRDKTEGDQVIGQTFSITNGQDEMARTFTFDPVAEMNRRDAAVGRLLESGYTFLTANDGHLAAMAAADRYAKPETTVAGDIINGTGIGGHVARISKFTKLWTPDEGPWEVGHEPLLFGHNPSVTFESIHAGPAIKERMESGDESPLSIWRGVGLAMADKVVEMVLNGGAQVIAMSGGVNVHQQSKIEDPLQRRLEEFANSGNPMAHLIGAVEVHFVQPAEDATYEMRGAAGLVKNFLAEQAALELIRTNQA